MHCDKCSYDNPADYRFCGMCGATLGETTEVQAPEIKRAAVSRDRVAPRVPTPMREDRTITPVREERYGAPVREERYTEPLREQRVVREERLEQAPQTISGPSFLGLGDSSGGGGYNAYSSSPEYLLDDEEPKRSFGRFVFILLLLAAIGGLGWMRYTRGNWVPPWVRTALESTKKNPEQQSQAPPAETSPPQTSATADNTQGTATESNIPPATTGNAVPAAQSPTPAADQPPANTSDAGVKGESTSAAKSTPAKNQAKANSPDEATDDSAEEDSAPPTRTSSAKSPVKKTVVDDNEDVQEASTKRRSSKTPPAPPAEEPSPDDALVANAEKYLYGRGVPQNCDRALSSLRAAAARQNSRARSLLGTMYATGHCVGRDLPNAYRWFALASRENADNMWVQRNLEMIWREMTPQERQLATQRSQ